MVEILGKKVFCLLKNTLEMVSFLQNVFPVEEVGNCLESHTKQQGRELPSYQWCLQVVLFLFSTLFSHVSTLFEVKFISAFFSCKITGFES